MSFHNSSVTANDAANRLTDGISVLFGLVSNQAAINQQEAGGEGRRQEDK